MSRQGGVPYMSNLTAHRPDFFKSITIYFKHHENNNYIFIDIIKNKHRKLCFIIYNIYLCEQQILRRK